MAKKVTAMVPRTNMTTTSIVVLPEEVVGEEVEPAEEEVGSAEAEVELEEDVATGAVGLEELPPAPTTGVVLVGVV